MMAGMLGGTVNWFRANRTLVDIETGRQRLQSRRLLEDDLVFSTPVESTAAVPAVPEQLEADSGRDKKLAIAGGVAAVLALTILLVR